MLAHGKDGHASHFHQRIRVPNGRIRAGLARINGNCEMTKHECEWLATDVVMVGKIACESAPHLGRGDALTGHVIPLLILVSLCTGIVGLALLVYEIRHHRRHVSPPESEIDAAAQSAIHGEAASHWIG